MAETYPTLYSEIINFHYFTICREKRIEEIFFYPYSRILTKISFNRKQYDFGERNPI